MREKRMRLEKNMRIKRYKIVRPIILSFLTSQDQEDYILDSGFIECNEHAIWFIDSKGKKTESITTANEVEQFLKDKKIVVDKEKVC